MTPHCLEFEHDPRQFLRGDFVSRIALTDVMVLAELATQVAASKEYRAGPFPASQWIFFTQVWPITTDPGLQTGFADSQIPNQTIRVTGACAQIATFHACEGDTSSFS